MPLTSVEQSLLLNQIAGLTTAVTAIPITTPPPASTSTLQVYFLVIMIALPGDTTGIKLVGGKILHLGADGSIFFDNGRIPGFGKRLVQIGNKVWLQGKSDLSWWLWTGSEFAQDPQFDPRILELS